MKLKKILIAFLWLAVLAGVIVMIVHAGTVLDDVSCKGYRIKIVGQEQPDSLVLASDIKEIILSQDDSLVGKNFNTIDVNCLEKALEESIYIKDAQIGGSLEGELLVTVEPYNPIVRVINKYNEQFYLDETGRALPVRSQLPVNVLSVNGNFITKYNEIRPDTLIREISNLLECIRIINKDTFLRAQIGQIYIKENGHYLFVPLIGEHTVLFGSPEAPQERLEKMKIFYRDGLGTEAWKRCKNIDLRFKDRIVVQNK